jgi:biopolymer transport protein ExbB
VTLATRLEGSANAARPIVTGGISLALNATLLGLLIAIPALVGWSYYNKKVENLGIEMASLCEEFLRKHYRTQETVTPLAEAGGR